MSKITGEPLTVTMEIRVTPLPGGDLMLDAAPLAHLIQAFEKLDAHVVVINDLKPGRRV